LTTVRFLAAAILFSGCLMPYKFNPGEPTARIKSLHNDAPAICVNDMRYALTKAPRQDYFLVPAGRRLTISSYASFDSYPITYTCYPSLSFDPIEGQTYLLDLNVINRICVIEVVVENPASKRGLDPVLSTGAPDCHPK